ncbi:MAG: tail fiber domain-containing protein [Minisyncoccia bacterium]
MSTFSNYIKILVIALSIAPVAMVIAWTGPSGTPPNGNVSAPVNVAVSDQFKPGVFGANILNIYGSNQYLSFGTTTGSTGYGMRNNGGALEFKGSGGAWGALSVLASGGVNFDGNITQLVTHGNNMKLWLSAARNGGGTGEVGLYSWVSEPSQTWTGAGLARNIYNGAGFPRVNTTLSGQMLHFTEGGTIDFVIDTPAGARTTPMSISNVGRIDLASSGGAGGIISSGNYGGTGSAAYFPSGIWANGGSSWIYGTIYTNGAIVDPSAGTVRDAGGGWIRTYGATGWYSQTYGGGWHMSDTTWLRAYGNKGIYTAGTIRGDVSADSNQFCDPAHSYCSSAYGLWYVHTYYYSDNRLKKNIVDLPEVGGLAAIMKLRPVNFDWKDKTSEKELGHQVGLIAQEVEQVIPEVVDVQPDKTITLSDGTQEIIKGPKSVKYDNLVAPLIKAVQELKAENDALRTRVEKLEQAQK